MTYIDLHPRDEFVAGLRQYADYLDAHRDVPMTDALLNTPLASVADVERLASDHGLTVTYKETGNASCQLQFGPIVVHFYGYTDFKGYLASSQAKDAQRWATEQNMVIVPADEAGAS